MATPRLSTITNMDPILADPESEQSLMAKSRAYRWNGWRTDLNGGEVKDPVLRKPKQACGRGITNAQAKYLASLQRKVGEPYSGRGLTSAQAALEIGRLLTILGKESPQRKP